ncbi:MAG TPA: GMC family oxidoreductase N-terminal domain-containing protein [Steroidobacteraceae bacterium]|nr:GMC family oxidoreductase N-terminal domain-containing protein [Steroidobacteraceae bacterium]
MADVAQGFDYVVVGGGTAGCALAARLSEDSRRTVCLLEAGGSGRSVFVNVPGTIVMAQRSDALNWRFRSVPQPQLDGRRISVPRGRGLGGSALINGMVYFRGNPRDYDAWAAAGAKGWSYREVLPYFRKSEHNENFGPSVYHGSGGPMNVRKVTRPNPLNFSFFDALTSLGYSFREDLNGTDSEGMGLRQLSIRGGTRETTASALLRPALGRPNLVVLTGTQATRIVLEGRRAVAVETRSAGVNLSVKAHREIVLAAGAIQSPQLLMLSGIGDGEHLAALGLTVRHELPGVGRNLHDHLASPVHMRMRNPVSYGLSLRAMPRNLWNIAEYLLFRRGPLANNVFESAAFVKSMPGLDKPDIQLVFQPAKRPGPSFPYPIGHGFAISPVGLYPRSRGRVTLASPDPFDAPLIDPNLLSAPEDLPPLISGIRLARKIFASAAFSAYRAQEAAPGSGSVSDTELAAYVRAEAYTVHHPVSTCRMGNDAAAVVDPQLRVVGLENLRVADASVFPCIIGGNTNAAVVMIAEKASDMILGRPSPAPETFEA